MPHKVAIIGTGNVGSYLGRSLSAAGYIPCFGSRDPKSSSIQTLIHSIGHGATAKHVVDACATAEFIFLCVSFQHIESTISSCGDLSGKILIDCTNPLTLTADQGLQLSIGFTDSAGEIIQRLSPHTKVIKAFNTYGYENYHPVEYPNASNLKPLMMMAGDDLEAKEKVSTLITALGFEAFDAGGIVESRLLEPMALLWIHQSHKTKERNPNFVWAKLTR